MKLNTEDEQLPPLDPFLQLLFALWREGMSVNSITAKRELRIIPAPDQSLVLSIREHWGLLNHLLPGVCDACLHWSLSRTETYWGAHPHLCPTCVNFALAYFEANNVWPEANWYDGEAGGSEAFED